MGLFDNYNARDWFHRYTGGLGSGFGRRRRLGNAQFQIQPMENSVYQNIQDAAGYGQGPLMPMVSPIKGRMPVERMAMLPMPKGRAPIDRIPGAGLGAMPIRGPHPTIYPPGFQAAARQFNPNNDPMIAEQIRNNLPYYSGQMRGKR